MIIMLVYKWKKQFKYKTFKIVQIKNGKELSLIEQKENNVKNYKEFLKFSNKTKCKIIFNNKIYTNSKYETLM